MASFNSRMDGVRGAFLSGDFDGVTKFTDNKDYSQQDDLELLVSGNALFNAGNYSESDKVFEEFNKRNTDTNSFSLMREFTTITTGAMSTDYRPYMMDTLFVSYYQILSALAENRWSDARVIINQSYARQQKMSREYKNLINKKSESVQSAMDLEQDIRDNNAQWAAYSDIMNPALMYLSGIYFLSDSDFSTAETYLNRATGMTNNNSYVTRDLELARNKTKPENTTWVFIENGFAPKLVEKRINIPWLVGPGISMITIAVAEPVFNNSTLNINGAKKIADVNAMFMTEFNEYSVNSALRSAAAAAARVVLQTSAYNSKSKFSPLLGLGATIFSIATTSADIRNWGVLPEYIYAIRTDTPKSGLLELKSGGNVVTSINMNKSGNNIVYIRFLGQNTVVHIMNIK